MKKIMILGAGMTGLSAAYFLQRQGADLKVHEKEPAPGGLCRSLKTNGFTFDYAERFLRVPDENFKNLISGIMGGNISQKKLSASIYFRGRYVRYPFQKNLFDLPEGLRRECLRSYLKTAKRKKTYTDFAAWARGNFGDAIARYFMIPYNSKIWAYDPAKMSVDWFRGEFLPKHDMDSVKEGAELPPHMREEKSAQFRWYPKRGGAQAIPEAFAGRIEKRSLLYDSRAKRIDLKKRKVVFQDGKADGYSALITTIPLNELVGIIDQAPKEVKAAAGRLKYNSALCLNFRVKRQDLTDKHWVYFPENKFVFSRLYFIRNFSENSAPRGESAISALITYTKDKPVSRKNAAKKALQGIKACGMVRRDDKLDLIALQDIKYAFAIPTLGLARDRGLIQSFLRQNDIHSIGRYGNWEYSGIEHAVKAGKNIAEEVLEA